MALVGHETLIQKTDHLDCLTFLCDSSGRDRGLCKRANPGNVRPHRQHDRDPLRPHGDAARQRQVHGKVLITGGYSPSLDSGELYDPSTGTFSATGSMAGVRYFHTATPLDNDKVLVAGGAVGCCGVVASAELYVPPTPSDE
jgi:hypothetical protein